jgi:hypothetical protein
MHCHAFQPNCVTISDCQLIGCAGVLVGHSSLEANLGSRCVERSERSRSLLSLKSEAKKANKTQAQILSTISGAI